VRKILIFLGLLFLFSCSITKNYELYDKAYCPIFPRITKVVVFSFEEGIKEGTSIRKEGNIQEGASEKLATFTEEELKKVGCFQIITWEEVKTKIEQNGLLNIQNISDTETIKKLGEVFKADAVLKGYVLKYVDKIGGKYGISSPASVSFIIHIYDTKDGSLIWSGSYKETQISLSENLLNIDLFFKRGLKWLTSDELAKFGVSEIIKKIPGVSK